MTPIMITKFQTMCLIITIGFMVFGYLIVNIGSSYSKENRYKRNLLEECKDIKLEIMYCPTVIDLCSIEGWINTLEQKYRKLINEGRFIEDQINELYKKSNERRQQLRKFLQVTNQN
jgi:benzoyl-CoA reductase/2-hydroxyglutaryl-CoA dehydratase subunit BcrC/BadD/HgdB